MNILVTGANGFLAREIIILLASQGHRIVGCVRNSSILLDENIPLIQTDFQHNLNKSDWMPHLIKHQIDLIINCVGVFQTVTTKEMWNIHYHAPRALFDACQEVGVKKIIQISALGIDKSDVDYAKSKLAAEDYLQNLNIDSVIIRPSFVYGKGSYGGSSLFRGLSGLPFFIFLPGSGQQLLQPIHVDDLANIVAKSLAIPGKQFICAVGAEKITLKNLLNKMRRWLGFKKAINISIPLFLVQTFAKCGNFFRNAPLSSTGVRLMSIDNVVSDETFDSVVKKIGFAPRTFTQGLNEVPSAVQDRWHARLFFLRPLLRITIGLLWVFTGIISIVTANRFGFPLLTQAGIQSALQPFLLYSASVIDFLLGVAVLCNYRLKIIGSLQIMFILIFTVIVSLRLPELWLHPFTPIAKNITLIMGTLVMMALESDR